MYQLTFVSMHTVPHGFLLLVVGFQLAPLMGVKNVYV